MAVSLISTGVQFPDSSVQTTAAGPLTIKATSSYTTAGSDNWVKASGVTGDTVIAVVIGGGGSGGNYLNASASGAATGGGGGGVCVIGMPYEDCPASVTVFVGQGGPAPTSTSVGTAGTSSSFGGFAIGGGGGGGFLNTSANWSARVARGGWGGGGMPGGGSTNNSNSLVSPVFATNDGSGGWEGRMNGGIGRGAVYDTAGGFTFTTTFPIPAGLTGGGGSVVFDGSVYRTQNATGGVGRIFGSGGTGATAGSTSGSTGGSPGGGGGGHISTGGSGSSGAGGVGAVYVYVVQGYASASDILLRASGTNYTVFY